MVADVREFGKQEKEGDSERKRAMVSRMEMAKMEVVERGAIPPISWAKRRRETEALLEKLEELRPTQVLRLEFADVIAAERFFSRLLYYRTHSSNNSQHPSLECTRRLNVIFCWLEPK